MAAVKRKPSVKLEDLVFYFDAVERDRLETSGTSRKAGEVLALRDRLVRLPDEQFDAAIKTLKSLVADAAFPAESSADTPRRQGGRDLYEVTRRAANGGGSGTTGKVSPT